MTLRISRTRLVTEFPTLPDLKTKLFGIFGALGVALSSNGTIVHLLDDDDEVSETNVAGAPASSSINGSAIKSPKVVPSQLEGDMSSGSSSVVPSSDMRTNATSISKSPSQQSTVNSIIPGERQLQLQQQAAQPTNQYVQSFSQQQTQVLTNSQLYSSIANPRALQLRQTVANSFLIQPHAGQISSYTGMQHLMRPQQTLQSQQPIQMMTNTMPSHMITQLLIEQGMQNPIYGLHYQQIQSVGAIPSSIQPIGGTLQTNALAGSVSSNSNSITENAMVAQGSVVSPSVTSDIRVPTTNVNRASINLQNQVAEFGGFPSVGHRDGKN
ncbi:15896_t:CDS:2 [Acaulospora colombiana]|uniref:15896_t:CDS:1 n=1 Tax=Acaulospora colombiana TaxID=27376 RepID=A0ACA9LH48_9GLOM|nr:15896_t:CDS:2 [Acaulospora colombiana]